MAIFGASVDLGLALLIVAVAARYAGLKLDGRPLNLFAAGALVFVLAGVLSGVNFGVTIPPVVGTVLNAVGTIAVVVGALLAVYKLVMSEK